jgi:hypothetical protein
MPENQKVVIHHVYDVHHCSTVRVSRAGVEYFSCVQNFSLGRVGYANGAW